MYRARDAIEQEEWLADLERAADRLELDSEARSNAKDLFLSTVPDADRSKTAALAASIYAGALLASDQRSQGDVADAVGVTRLTVQQRWKGLLAEAGFDVPDW
jgi:transcription initiation factor TFIIIB Brf1 subunit/transcription initiation factor TFIIB